MLWPDSHTGTTGSRRPTRAPKGGRPGRRASPRPPSPARPDAVVELDRLEEAAHEVVRAVAPELTRVTKWGHPWYAGNDLVLLVGAFSHHVGVEFWRGTTLRDPGRLLEGTGKNLRHVKLRRLEDATAPAFVELVKEAVRLDRSMPIRVR